MALQLPYRRAASCPDLAGLPRRDSSLPDHDHDQFDHALLQPRRDPEPSCLMRPSPSGRRKHVDRLHVPNHHLTTTPTAAVASHVTQCQTVRC
ncbi:hypothetical protein BC567DRAFT_226820 [Phyllosticta citribraziliensis]